MICEATSLKKYIDKSPRLFFVYGPEIILKNDSIDHINEFYKKHGFTEKKAIFDKDFKDIERILIENAGGSLFGSKTIVEIFHYGGKIPKEITNIFEIPNINKMENIVIIIRSAIEKINLKTKWVKRMNDISLIVQCAKLKSFEEKIWVKDRLSFMNERDAKNYTNKITDLFSGNLVAVSYTHLTLPTILLV